MQGKCSFPSLVEVSPDATVKPLPGNGWWADVTLDPDESIPVSVFFENRATSFMATIAWTSFNVLVESDILLRVGDSLKLTAHPEGVAEGTASIAIVGLTNFVVLASECKEVKFSQPGCYTVSAEYYGSGVPVSNSLKVSVVGASLGGGVSVWMGKNNSIFLPNVPQTNATVIIDSDLCVGSFGTYNNGIKGTLFVPVFNGERSLAVVLPNERSSVIDSAPVNGFYAYYTIEGGYHVVETLSDGTRVIENRISTSTIPNDVSLEMSTWMPGICFEGGAPKLVLTKDDFDETGELTYRFYAAPNVTNPCQFLRAIVAKQLVSQ
jgi:hypothetical protein